MKWLISAKLESIDDSFIDVLLESRGLKTKKEKKEFLNPQPIFKMLKELPDEFKDNSKKTIKLIENKIKDGKPIIIHGDYDADGICATAILTRVLRNELGYSNTYVFIPNRFEHGYGLSTRSVDACKTKLEKRGISSDGALLITVDSGITSYKEVEYAKKLGFDVVITDHHQKPDKLPNPEYIVWSDEIVGSGIAWVLAKLLRSKDDRLLGLAALATVTDLQPLFKYNRSIVKEGLESLNTDSLPGIKAIYQVSGKASSELTTYDLGWVIGPRINASGRMGDSTDALALLLEDDFDKALKYAIKLNQTNLERQNKTEDMYELASFDGESDLPKVIISVSENYHEGIIGLVASKLVQKHYRPTIVVSLEDGIGKGSVRSVSGVNIISFLREFEEIFENVGGHPMAAGFTIKKENISLLRDKVSSHSNQYVKEEYLQPTIDVDLEVPLSIVDNNFLEKLNKLKPFGVGNRSPIFVSRNLGVVDMDTVGANNLHLSLKLLDSETGKIYRAIFFGGSEYKDKISLSSRVDIAYSAKENHFNGKVYINLVLKDLKKSKP